MLGFHACSYVCQIAIWAIHIRCAGQLRKHSSRESSVINLRNIDSREVHYKQTCGTVMVSLVLGLTSNALVGQKLLINHANAYCKYVSGQADYVLNVQCLINSIRSLLSAAFWVMGISSAVYLLIYFHKTYATHILYLFTWKYSPVKVTYYFTLHLFTHFC